MARQAQMLQRRFAAGALGLVMIAAPAAALAQDGKATDRTEAEARFQEGLTLYKEGSIDEARLKLIQAYAVLGRPNILWNLSVAEFYSNHPLESLRHMRKYLKLPEATPHDVNLARETFIPALERQTGKIEVHALDGTALKVDDEDAGVTPLAEPLDVMPGHHVVVAHAQNKDTKVEIDVPAGQTIPAVFAEPARAIDVKTETPPLEPRRSMTARNVTVVVLAAGAVVAAGVGIAFLASADSDATDGETLAKSLGNDKTACTGSAGTSIAADCAKLRDLYDSRDSSTGLATGFFIGAGALAVAAGLTYALWPKDPERSRGARRVPFAVAPRPGGAAAVFDMAF